MIAQTIFYVIHILVRNRLIEFDYHV